MNSDKKDFLMLATPPARQSITEAAWYLGCSEQDISVLVSAGHLKPLGHPPPSGSKYFATVELQRLRADAHWLAKISDAIVGSWRKKNASRANRKSGVTNEIT